MVFNDWFSSKFHRRDFENRLRLLIECGILHRQQDHYSFRYPYIYYFFLGKYLAENLQEVSIKERIKRYCEHLYVRDYANSILFCAHHSRDPYVYEQIAKVLKKLFNDKKPIEFNGDNKTLAYLVESAPEMAYHGGDVTKNRKEFREFQDQLETEVDLEPETEEEESISLISKLNLLFKNG